MNRKNIVDNILNDNDNIFNYLRCYKNKEISDEEISKILYYNHKIINLGRDYNFAKKLFFNYLENDYDSSTVNCWILHNLAKFPLEQHKKQIEENILNSNSLKYLLSIQCFDKNIEYNDFIINKDTIFLTNIPYFYKFIKHNLKNKTRDVIKIMLVNLLKLNDNYYHFLYFLNKYSNVFVKKMLINKFNSKRGDNITHKIIYSLIKNNNKNQIKNGCKILKYFLVNNRNLFSKTNDKEKSSLFYLFYGDNLNNFETTMKYIGSAFKNSRYKDNQGNGFIHYLKNKDQYLILTKYINSNYLIFCNNNKENALHTLLKKKYISFEHKASLIRLFVTLKINLYKKDIFALKPVDLIHPSVRAVLEDDGIL